MRAHLRAALFLFLTCPPALAGEQGKLVASDGTSGDTDGQAVAVQGDTAILGAYFADGLSSSTGKAYVFVRSGTTWTEQAGLTAPDVGSFDRFGWSVALDGDTAVVGTIFGDGLAPVSGSAYVYTRTGAVWTQQAKIQSADGASSDWFSRSVALEGDTLVVGAPQDDDLGADSGSVYVFTRSGAAWSQAAKLTASDGVAGDGFGWWVSLDAGTLLVGAPQDDDGGASSGSAYVFVGGGAAWSEQAKLTAADAGLGDFFGLSASVEGDTAVVGAYRDDHVGQDAGSAYVFTRSGTTWSQQAKLTASDAAADDELGFSVSVSGERVLLGAPGDDSATGAAYLFRRSGTSWSEAGKLTASDAATGDQLGFAVSLDLATALAGAPGDDDAGSGSGSGYVFFEPLPYTPLCFGDGSLVSCPCGNESVPGAGEGCVNSQGHGAVLGASGTNEVALDDLVLHVSQARPTKNGVFLQGGTFVSNLFRDGILCTGNPTERLEFTTLDAGGSASSTASIVTEGNVLVGQTRYYQFWFRDGMGPCGTGSNLSNALEVVWQ